MTSEQLQASWLAAQQRLEAHVARRDGRFHARQSVDPTLGDRVAADKHLAKRPTVTK